MDHTESFQVHLSSKYLPQGTASSAFFCTQTAEVPSDYQLHLSVISASIPYSFYSVSSSSKLVVYSSESVSTTYLLSPSSVIAHVSPSNYKTSILASVFSVISVELVDQYSNYVVYRL